MSDLNDFVSWVAIAEEDLKIAKSALRFKPPSAYGASFHAQQCAEKYLKALLVSGDHPYSKIHDLRKLSDECDAAGIFVLVSIDDLDTLSMYAIRVRYPDDPPSLDEAREAILTAKKVRTFARKYLVLQ